MIIKVKCSIMIIKGVLVEKIGVLEKEYKEIGNIGEIRGENGGAR